MPTTAFSLSLLLVALTAVAPSSLQRGWRVGLRSYGPIHYGMTLSEASHAVGETLSVADSECDYVFPRAFPPRTALMIEEGHVERVDVDTTGILTRSGIGVGSTEDEIKEVYGQQIRTEPHPYTGPEGHYLIYVPRDPVDTGFALIFETDGHRVTGYRAGRRPAVEYIEGCS